MGDIPLYRWRARLRARACPVEKWRRRPAARHAPASASSLADLFRYFQTEQRPEVAAGNAHLIRVARELDPTRLAVHVSNHWREDPHFAEDDVLCVNGYPSLNRRGLGGDPAYDLAASTAWWRDGLSELHARYPDKPILVAEFGYAALEGSRQSALGEDWQAQSIEAESETPPLCGATIWC